MQRKLKRSFAKFNSPENYKVFYLKLSGNVPDEFNNFATIRGARKYYSRFDKIIVRKRI